MTTQLSKSRYTKFCQCPKALWLSINKPEEATVDPGVEARFAQGNVVGDLAMQLFGDFVEVTTQMEDGRLDLKTMIQRTQEEMERGTEVICEASFRYNKDGHGNYCAVDILRRTPMGWAIYEVKSTTCHVADITLTDSKIREKVQKYAPDIAFQRWVLEQCGVNVTDTYLVMLNSDYVRQGELCLGELFNVVDMKELVDAEYLKVPGTSALAHKILEAEGEDGLKEIGTHCFHPYKCAFWGYCTRHLPSPSVFNVYGGQGRGGFSTAKKMDCYNKGLVSFQQLSTLSIGKIQDMQIHCTLNDDIYIDKEGIQKFLDKVTYPLYFLDFETMQQLVPQYDGTRPYQQLTFQYSLHYIEHEGGELKHKAYLAPSDGANPLRALAEALCNDIPMNVCTMAYNDPFEKGRIEEMAKVFPDLSSHLLNIREGIVDLLIPFRQGCYYTPAMGGSFSIKSVLPALFPDDEELNYHNLNPLVQNGGDAMTIFPRIKDMPHDEALAARQALLDYCHLDTLAMVRVWEKLKEVVDDIKSVGHNGWLAEKNSHNKWQIIDACTRKRVDGFKEYDSFWSFGKDGLCMVRKDSSEGFLYGYVNEEGDEQIPVEYEHLYNFENGITVAKKDGEYGIIDMDNNVVIPFGLPYAEVRGLRNGRAAVKGHNGLWGVINTKGKLIVPCESDKIIL